MEYYFYGQIKNDNDKMRKEVYWEKMKGKLHKMLRHKDGDNINIKVSITEF
jgi:hypothetical protein